MRLLSVNLNQRLGNAATRARIEEWLLSYSPDLFLAQEPFSLSSSVRPDLDGFRLLATNPLTTCWVANQHPAPAVVQISDRWQKTEYSTEESNAVEAIHLVGGPPPFKS